jgi:hypothetical protein
MEQLRTIVTYGDKNPIHPLPFSPNMEPLKTIVTYRNNNPIHPPFLTANHPPFLPIGSTKSKTITLLQNNGFNQAPNMEKPAARQPETPLTPDEFLTQREQEQNKNNFETQSNFASELEIENIGKEIQN